MLGQWGVAGSKRGGEWLAWAKSLRGSVEESWKPKCRAYAVEDVERLLKYGKGRCQRPKKGDILIGAMNWEGL